MFKHRRWSLHWRKVSLVTKTQGFYSTLACVHDVKRFDRGWINIIWKPQGWNPSSATCFHLLHHLYMNFNKHSGKISPLFCVGSKVVNPCKCLFTEHTKINRTQQTSAGPIKRFLNCKSSNWKKSTRGEQMENSSADALTALERAVGGEQLGFGRRMNKWWDVLERKCPNKTR